MARFLEENATEDPEVAAFLADNPDRRVTPVLVEPEFMTYWRGWHDLRNDRPFIGMGGVAGIYYTAISQYCQDFGIRGSEFRQFVRIIREMDDEYLAHVSARLSASSTSSEN